MLLLLCAGSLLGLVYSQEAPAQAAPDDSVPVVADHIQTTYYVEYTYYKKNRKTGVVTRLGSGRVGPYYTRREAQSVCDQYNSDDTTSGGYRYYYSARVRP
jgi:hypothetical protein